VAAPLVGGSAASAESDSTVTFSGGCGLLGSGLGAESSPDTTQVSVPAGSEVRFANGLGQDATLRLDGEAAAEVPAGGSADVVFHDGPVTASMQISCLLGAPAGSVTVEVTPVAEAPEQPSSGGDAEPASPQPSSGSTAGGGTSSQGGPTSQGGSTSRGGGSSTGGTSSTGGDDPSWAGWGPTGQAPPPATQPDDTQSPAGRGTSSHDGERHPRWGVEVEPADGGATSGDPATVDTEPAGNGLAAEQVSRTSESTPAPDDGPIGLLAMIATVCVVGVSAGAVRALITQRANRAEWA
jgi:hypothetical protein